MRTKFDYVYLAKVALATIFNVAVLLSYAGIFLVVINSNMTYFQDLPDVIKMAIPIAFIAGIFKILTINFSPFSLKKIDRKDEVNAQKEKQNEQK